MKAFLGLFAVLFSSQISWASAGSCLEILVREKDMYEAYVTISNEFSFPEGYRGFLYVAQHRQAEVNFFADHMTPPFAMLASRVSEGYEPARSFVLDIAKKFQELQNNGENPEAAKHLVNYYETMIALDVTGENVVRFAKAVDYDVTRGAEVLNLQKRLEQGEGIPSWELEQGLPTVDDILIYSIH